MGAPPGPITPPFPTDSPDPSSDQPVSGTYSPEQELNDRLAWFQKNKESVAQLLSELDDAAKSLPKTAGMAAQALGWVLHEIYGFLDKYREQWLGIQLKVYQDIFPDVTTFLGAIFGQAFGAFQQVISSISPSGGSFGSGPLGEVAQVLAQAVVQPFSLVSNAADPRTPGSGVANQQYLLNQALALAVANWFIDSASAEFGAGVLNTLRPIMWMITNAVNPYNAVRMAMDASYTAFIRQPLTRDINRAYPIKDLGLAALAKLFIRGEITEDVYLDKCLDSGINNTWAQQLILESGKLLSEGDAAKLHRMGIMSDDDVLRYLATLGYRPGDAVAKLYLLNHERFFAIQERVGNEAVTAWKHHYIDQTTLEQILHQMGFNDDEISLLEIEGQFTKKTTDQKKLDATQIRELFKRGLIGIDRVISFLSSQGYSADDVNLLVLLDFTAAEEQAVRTAELIARLRVEQELALVQAAAATKKQELELAKAKKALAAALDQAAAALGALQTASGISALLG